MCIKLEPSWKLKHILRFVLGHILSELRLMYKKLDILRVTPKHPKATERYILRRKKVISRERFTPIAFFIHLLK